MPGMHHHREVKVFYGPRQRGTGIPRQLRRREAGGKEAAGRILGSMNTNHIRLQYLDELARHGEVRFPGNLNRPVPTRMPGGVGGGAARVSPIPIGRIHGESKPDEWERTMKGHG